MTRLMRARTDRQIPVQERVIDHRRSIKATTSDSWTQPDGLRRWIRLQDRWFMSILCEEIITPLAKTGEMVGVDLGVKTYAVYSDGERARQRTESRFLISIRGLLPLSKTGVSPVRRRRVAVPRCGRTCRP